MKSNAGSLPVAGLFASFSVVLITFIGGCLYGFWMAQGPVHTPFGVHPNTDADVGGPLLIGFTIAVMILPLTLAFTFGIGLPFFYFWKRAGYSSAAAYFAGGLIVALATAAIITVAHVLLSDFLSLNSDFIFAMMLIAVSGPIAGLVVWRVLRRSFEVQPVENQMR